ncbi:alpha-glycosidase [Bacillus lacus]|uniref:Alpha-glycosidase n=1 Tax=Metabacillus lacus TaxID=1983721 RepID=A0A7X2J1P0_9BACI|nr:glycoside hydrolase family 13 protein [Metabacillus lacus]MRX73497.1 alpha-glycosidase [Metabacillus lacus]
MLRESIYHRPKNEFAYVYDEKTIHIRLKSKKGDVQKALLIHGDPYDWEDGNWVSDKIEMGITGSDELFDYWLVAIQPPNRRLRYGFELSGEEEVLFYTEKGFYSDMPTDDIAHYFCFPFLHYNDAFRAPEWVKNTVWYQIFPERFANGNPDINPEGTLEWNSTEPTPTNFFGGDFEGILQNLDYLKELGISGIYFTPIFKAYSNHKYDTIDYYEIDPQFGDKETFKRLVEECHNKDIRVMLDAVFNHSGYYFQPFQDVLENGADSEYKDWFHLHELPVSADPAPNYDTFAYEASMPKLNTQHPDVKKYLIDAGTYWVREFNIDGWRLDVANEVDHQFWREFRTAVKSVRDDIYILGEIWHDASPWLQGDQFDAVMNYPFTTGAISFFGTNSQSASEFSNVIQRMLHMYPENVTEVAFNLLGSHDTPRILNIADGNKERVKLLFAFQLSFSGSPCIYYGDEIALLGDTDPGCRKCMPWDEEEEDLDMLEHVKKLLSLRKDIDVFGNNGRYAFLQANDENGTLVILKEFENQRLLALFNNLEEETTIYLPEDFHGQEMTDLWTNDVLEPSEEGIIVPGLNFKFLLINDN